jgi:UDP-N-acetylglucosamine acyltransferase
MATHIDPLASVDPAAQLGEDVRIGPFCLVGPNVELRDGVELRSHVVVEGHTRVGAGTRVFSHATLGTAPQDIKYRGEETRLEIGENCLFREYANANIGTVNGGGVTRIAADGLFMIGVHIAHDCQIGRGAIFANHVTLGGHVTVGDHVFIGGLSAVHQFVRVGQNAYIGGYSPVHYDVVPYAIVSGPTAHLEGLNLIGLKRRGDDKDEINQLRAAYRAIFRGTGAFADRVDRVAADYPDSALVRSFVDFIRQGGKRSYTMHGVGDDRDA